MRTSLPLLATALASATLLALPTTASARGATPPANDDVADAAYLGEGGFYADTTVGATRAESDPENLPGEHTVWYAYHSYVGAPVEVVTQAESINPALSARFVVYQDTADGLETVATSSQRPADPSQPSRRQAARFPTVEDADYYIGVSNTADGADFGISLDRARVPSSVSFPDGTATGGGRPQLYTAPGDRPRVRVVVRTGFAGDVGPAQGQVSLRRSDTGRTFQATLRKGRATFVLPRIKHSYEIVVTYAGTATSDTADADAYLHAEVGPQRIS